MIALHYNTSLTCFSIIKLLIFIFKLTIKMYFILCILLYKILIVSTIYNIIYMQCIIMIYRFLDQNLNYIIVFYILLIT